MEERPSRDRRAKEENERIPENEKMERKDSAEKGGRQK